MFGGPPAGGRLRVGHLIDRDARPGTGAGFGWPRLVIGVRAAIVLREFAVWIEFESLVAQPAHRLGK
jgi:hypothetical protein